MSSLSEIRPGVWKVRGYAGIDPVTGRQRARTRTFHANGVRAARRVQSDIDSEWNDYDDGRAKIKGTVAELVDRWLTIQRSKPNLSPTYIARAEKVCERIVAGLGRVPARDLHAGHIEDWYVWLRQLDVSHGGRKRRLGEATVLHHHRILSAVLTTARRSKRVTEIATQMAEKPRGEHVETRPPTRAALDVLIADLPAHARFPIIALAQTGVRRGELFGMHWTDVDIDRQVMRVWNTTVVVRGVATEKPVPKGRKPRDVEFGAGFAAVLSAHRDALEAASPKLAADARLVPDLVTDPTGRTPMHPDWLSKLWARHTAKHGVECRLHDLRHYYGSSLMAAGVPLHRVQALMGHAKPSTTLDLYGHVLAESAGAAGLVMDALMPPP